MFLRLTSVSVDSFYFAHNFLFSSLSWFLPLLNHVERAGRGKLIRVALSWKLRSRGGLLAGGLMAAHCDVIDLDCRGAQLGVIAWQQIKDYIV